MTLTRRFALTALLASALAALAQTPAKTPAPANDPTLRAALREALSGSKTPAVAVLEMADGRVTRMAAEGRRRNDAPGAVTTQDRWLIGSNGKPLTATLLARLIDRGVLSWDTPLAELMPGLRESMHEAYRDATLLDLLSHRAGLPENDSDSAYFDTFYTDTRPLPAQRLAYVSHALKEAPAAPLRSKFVYSNTGILLAAVIAEAATGKPYEQLMREEVFGPLGMNSVGYGPTPKGDIQGHSEGKPVQRPQQSNPLMFAPDGNLHMTMQDWATFCLDQLAGARGQGKLLKPDSYRRMLTAPEGGNPVAWGRQASLAGRKGPVIMHAGSDGNWFAFVALFPESGRGALVAVNAGPDMDGDKVAQQAMMAVLPPAAP